MYAGYTERPEQIEAKRQAIAKGVTLPSQRRAPKPQPTKLDRLGMALAIKRQLQIN